MAVLATMGFVALVAVAAALVTLRRHLLARAQVRRSRAALATYSYEWNTLAADTAATVQELPTDQVPPEAVGRHAVADGPAAPVRHRNHERRAS